MTWKIKFTILKYIALLRVLWGSNIQGVNLVAVELFELCGSGFLGTDSQMDTQRDSARSDFLSYNGCIKID